MKDHFVIARHPVRHKQEKALLLSYEPPKYDEFGNCTVLASCSVEFVEDKSRWNMLPRQCTLLGKRSDHPFGQDVPYFQMANVKLAVEKLLYAP